MEEEKSFWFWILPPLLLGAVFAAYRFHLADRWLNRAPASPASPPAAAQPAAPTGPPPGEPPPPPAPARTALPDQAATPTPTEITTPAPAPPLSPAAAEALLSRLAVTLTANPTARTWLRTTHLLRHFVAAVDCVAGGASPRLHVLFFQVREPFRVRPGSGGPTIDPASWARYDTVAMAFASLDASACRAAYERLAPALDQAYRDLGYAEGSFRDLLTKAVGVLLATPVPDRNAALRPQGGVYVWTDPRLENCNEAQKHLLRMGPENIRKIQAKLRELATALELPLGAMPARPE